LSLTGLVVDPCFQNKDSNQVSFPLGLLIGEKPMIINSLSGQPDEKGFEALEKDPVLADVPPVPEQPFAIRRPIGIILLTAAHLLLGLGMVGLIFLYHTSKDKKDRQNIQTSYSPSEASRLMLHSLLIDAELVAFAILPLASGIGMLFRLGLGWMLALYFYLHILLLNLSEFIPVPKSAKPPPWPIRDRSELHGEYLFWAAISALMILYLCRKKVVRYFRLESINRIIILVLIALIASIIPIGFWYEKLLEQYLY